MTILVPLLAALLGLLVYALVTQPKMAELGRILFACGTLVALFVMAHASVKLLP